MKRPGRDPVRDLDLPRIMLRMSLQALIFLNWPLVAILILDFLINAGRSSVPKVESVVVKLAV